MTPDERRRLRDRQRYWADVQAQRERRRLYMAERRAAMTPEQLTDARIRQREAARASRARRVAGDTALSPEVLAAKREAWRAKERPEVIRQRARDRAAEQRAGYRRLVATLPTDRRWRRYSAEEDLVATDPAYTLAEAAVLLGRSPGSVANRRLRLNRSQP